MIWIILRVLIGSYFCMGALFVGRNFDGELSDLPMTLFFKIALCWPYLLWKGVIR